MHVHTDRIGILFWTPIIDNRPLLSLVRWQFGTVANISSVPSRAEEASSPSVQVPGVFQFSLAIV